MSSLAVPRRARRRESFPCLGGAAAAAAPVQLLRPDRALLSRAVYEPTIADALPRTVEALRQDSAGLPGEPLRRLGDGSQRGSGGGDRP